MEKVAQIVKSKLDSKEFNVTELAELSGCSRQYIYDLLKSPPKYSLTVPMAEKLLQICGYKLDIKMQKATA